MDNDRTVTCRHCFRVGLRFQDIKQDGDTRRVLFTPTGKEHRCRAGERARERRRERLAEQRDLNRYRWLRDNAQRIDVGDASITSMDQLDAHIDSLIANAKATRDD